MASVKVPSTPLPKLTVLCLILMQTAESIAYTSIIPFVQEALLVFGIVQDPRNVGYLSGAIESIFFLTESIFVLRWCRLSDRIGRKKVLLIGLAGSALSVLLFGFSRTLFTMIASRALLGLTNGNIGVTKAALAEVTDSSNRARAYSFVPLAWSFGTVVGPILGGGTASLRGYFAERSPLLRSFPYLVPCSVAALFPTICAIISIFCLQETLNKRSSYVPVGTSEDDVLMTKSPDTPSFKEEADEPEGKDAAFTAGMLLRVPPVRNALINYVALCLTEISFFAVVYVWLFTPIEFGGLEYNPSALGLAMAAFGILGGCGAIYVAPKMQRKLSSAIALRYSSISFTIAIFCMPVANQLARSAQSGSHWTVLALLAGMTVCNVFGNVCFSCTMCLVNEASPNDTSLGCLNGIGQSGASIVRAIGPALSTSLFALTIEKQLFHGYLIYVYLLACSVQLWGATFLLDVSDPQRADKSQPQLHL